MGCACARSLGYSLINGTEHYLPTSRGFDYFHGTPATHCESGGSWPPEPVFETGADGRTIIAGRLDAGWSHQMGTSNLTQSYAAYGARFIKTATDRGQHFFLYAVRATSEVSSPQRVYPPSPVASPPRFEPAHLAPPVVVGLRQHAWWAVLCEGVARQPARAHRVRYRGAGLGRRAADGRSCGRRGGGRHDGVATILNCQLSQPFAGLASTAPMAVSPPSLSVSLSR